LLASKSSPTAVRGQFYGFAAAIGKIGAFVGTWGEFTPAFPSERPSLIHYSVFPRIIDGKTLNVGFNREAHFGIPPGFGGPTSEKGNTGPFWIGSG